MQVKNLFNIRLQPGHFLVVASIVSVLSGPLLAATEATPEIAVSLVGGPRTNAGQIAMASDLLKRLERDGWFTLAPETSVLELDDCKSVHFTGQSKCREQLTSLQNAGAGVTPPRIAFVFTSARNQLANLDCLGAGRYPVSGMQSMLSDYRLALSENKGSERERAEIATCILAASRDNSEKSKQGRQHPSNAFACPPHSLEGEWQTEDGIVIRFSGPFSDPFNKKGEGEAFIIRPGTKTSSQGKRLYRRIRRMADCNFLVERHYWLDNRLHAAQPHTVELQLDRAAGTLRDDYSGGQLVFKRLAGPLPIWGK